MSQYSGMAQRARATIARKGGKITFPGGGAPIYDPLTDTYSGGGSAAVTGVAVQIPGEPDKMAALGLVLVNPVTLELAAFGLGIVPTPGGTFTWAGKTYTIKFCEAVAPSGDAITYHLVGDV